MFHNCPQEEQQQSNPKDLGSKYPRSKMWKKLKDYARNYLDKIFFLSLDHI